MSIPKPTAHILHHDSSIRLNVIHRGSFILRDNKLGLDRKQLGPTNRYFRFGEALELMSQGIPFRFELDIHAASVLYTVYSRKEEFSEQQFKALYELFLRYIPAVQLNRLTEYLPEPFKTISDFLQLMDSIANKSVIARQIKGIDDVEYFGKRKNDTIVNIAEEMQRSAKERHDTPYNKLDRNSSLVESSLGVKPIPTKDDFTLNEGVLPDEIAAVVNNIGRGVAKLGGFEHEILNATEIEGLGPKVRHELRRAKPEAQPVDYMGLPEEPSGEDLNAGIAIMQL